MTSLSTEHGKQFISPSVWAFVAGTFGGFAGVVAGHPFDTLKVRLQSQLSGPTAKYKGTTSAFFQILREEKMRGLYKGMSSPLIGVGLVNSMLFGVHGFLLDVQKVNSNDESTLAQIFWAGCGSGIANSIISGPVENQVECIYKGPLDCLKKIYLQGGLKECLRGMKATLYRDTPSYGAYFMSFEYLCRTMTPLGEATETLGNGSLMLAGGLAGVIGWVSTYPMDVIKTIIQAHDPFRNVTQLREDKGQIKKSPYNTIHQAYKYIYDKEGYRGLFKGLNATIIRAFPTNAATFLIYSWMTRAYWSHVYISDNED